MYGDGLSEAYIKLFSINMHSVLYLEFCFHSLLIINFVSNSYFDFRYFILNINRWINFYYSTNRTIYKNHADIYVLSKHYTYSYFCISISNPAVMDESSSCFSNTSGTLWMYLGYSTLSNAIEVEKISSTFPH